MVHVVSWTGRTVYPLMQFQRVAGLPEGPHVNGPDPPWGSHPTVGSIPEAECRTLVETLRGFTNPRIGPSGMLVSGEGQVKA